MYKEVAMNVDDKIKEAFDKGVVAGEEFGFINNLIGRFKADIIKKEKLVTQTMGEINQLRINLDIIKEMALNMIAAQERAEERIITAAKLRGDRASVQADKMNAKQQSITEVKDKDTKVSLTK